MTQKSLIRFLPLISVLVLGCAGKETDADKIADAQNCLDTATAATADTCVEKVAGMESSGAYLIRCVGKFAKEGFNTPSKISAALAAQTGGGSGSLGMMSALQFKAEATTALNSTSAQTTFTYCTRANSQGLIFLSGLVQTATTLAGLANDPDLTGNDLKTIMDTQKNNPVAQAAVGTAVVGMYEANCTGGANNANGSFCTQFSTAVAAAGGASNTTAIGQLVMLCYSTPTDPACANLSGFN